MSEQWTARLEEAPRRGKLHGVKRQSVRRFPYLKNWDDVGVLETRGRFGFAAKSSDDVVRIAACRQNALERNDAARMGLLRPVNNTHSAARDFIHDFVVGDAPIPAA